MSLTRMPLVVNTLATTIPVTMAGALSKRVLLSIRDGMAVRGLSQRDLAGILECSQSRIAKLLNGRVGMDIDDLEVLCFAVSIQPTEAVRDRGLEFVADLTPTELRIIELIRRLPAPTRDAVLHLLRLHPESDIELRGATRKRSRVGKPRPR